MRAICIRNVPSLAADDDLKVGQRQTLHGQQLTVNASDVGRAVDEDAVLIEDVDDRAQLAGVRAIVDEGDAADFDEASVHLLYQSYSRERD